ncbi:PREDICTED: cytochrome b5 reductase 4-like [Galeopterus variegatus]|uniref:Cytochrome b5 reductase 4-like n=1 Tax=Galeopterus variegatus TaxID=482537 RepID=A0ABM0SD78_GALVR|nr:PREDICTED: cytochrome b5 reductase 4-like [Galeopterus variegatus]
MRPFPDSTPAGAPSDPLAPPSTDVLRHGAPHSPRPRKCVGGLASARLRSRSRRFPPERGPAEQVLPTTDHGRGPGQGARMLNVPSQSFPAPSSQQRIASGGRSKVPLKQGRSLMDWIRLTKSGKDLTGLKGRLIEVTEEELKKHNKKDDCWICIRGFVYNVSPYMEYHPGGEDELMRAAGSDGTDLFDQF